MNTRQLDILKAVYFSDIEQLRILDLTRDDLIFDIDIPIYYQDSNWKELKLTVMEILRMNHDCWYDCKDQESLGDKDYLNPSKIYKSVLDCINFFNDKFPDIEIKDVEYEKYTKFHSSYDEDDNWIDEEDYESFVSEGYRAIDLDLINYGVKRNAVKVRELMHNGADSSINPDDKEDYSEILDVLGSEDALSFIDVESVYSQKIKDGIDVFEKYGAYGLIADLYGTASASKIRNIILNPDLYY